MEILSAIFGADIEQRDGQWRTSDVDPAGVTYATLRDHAAVALYKKDVADGREPILLVQGGLAKPEHNQPSIASVMREELVRLGVPSNAIELEEHSGSTRTQLIELQSYIASHECDIVRIVSNTYHLPRIQAMIENIPELGALRTKNPILVGAEDILVESDGATWRTRTEAMAQEPAMLERVAKEKAGAEQIKKGNYTYRPQ